MKRCSKCGEEKGLGEFGKKKGKKDGLNIYCKSCVRANQSSRAALAKAGGPCRDCRQNPAKPGQILCFECAEKQKRASASRRDIARAGGPCCRCGENPAHPGQVHCLKCAKTRYWSSLKRTYGLSKEGFYALLEAQGGVCASCKKVAHTEKDPLNVDHNHITGGVRELLCRGCNTAIGNMKEQVENFEAAIAYLKKHNKAA